MVKVLSMIHEDERNTSRAGGLVRKMESFSFVLNMKLMLKVLRITVELMDNYLQIRGTIINHYLNLT